MAEEERSRLSLMQFAEGIVRVVNANMEKAIRVVSIEKGFDTRDFSLVAFVAPGRCTHANWRRRWRFEGYCSGDAGCAVGCGILMSDIVKDYSRTCCCKKNFCRVRNCRPNSKAWRPKRCETSRWSVVRQSAV